MKVRKIHSTENADFYQDVEIPTTIFEIEIGNYHRRNFRIELPLIVELALSRDSLNEFTNEEIQTMYDSCFAHLAQLEAFIKYKHPISYQEFSQIEIVDMSFNNRYVGVSK